MIRSILLALLLSTGLMACSSAPPAPVDRFYRLEATPINSSVLVGPVEVLPFQADSLYAERPLVFSVAGDTRQLQQYHYHLWLYPPKQLVRDHLTASLGLISSPAGKGAAMTLEGRVLRLDRVISGKSGKAVVTLELRLKRGEKLVFSKTYEADQEAAGEGVSAHVLAVEQALGKVYADFLKDTAMR